MAADGENAMARAARLPRHRATCGSTWTLARRMPAADAGAPAGHRDPSWPRGHDPDPRLGGREGEARVAHIRRSVPVKTRSRAPDRKHESGTRSGRRLPRHNDLTDAFPELPAVSFLARSETATSESTRVLLSTLDVYQRRIRTLSACWLASGGSSCIEAYAVDLASVRWLLPAGSNS